MTEYSSAIALVERLIRKKGRKNVSIYRSSVSTATDVDRPWKLDSKPTAPDQLIASGLHAVFIDPRQTLSLIHI